MAITLSAGVRQSLPSLQSSAAQASTIQNRLATGKKVNSALDNPANFFTASGLNNRATDSSRLLDDMGQAVQDARSGRQGHQGDHQARRERPVARQAGRVRAPRKT